MSWSVTRSGPPFSDRREAGARLARRLFEGLGRDVGGGLSVAPLVFALPRGGVPVGFEVARGLGAPLDVLVARKLGAPGRPELGIGAVAEGGVRFLDERAVRSLGVPAGFVEEATRRESARAAETAASLGGSGPGGSSPGGSRIDASGRTAVIVDDGLATGATARAAALSLKTRSPRRVVLAAPVCAAPTADALRREGYEVVALREPPDLGAIGFWYKDFEQVSDAEVQSLLEESRRAQ